MKDTTDSLETDMKRLTREVLDFETELSQQEAEYVSHSLLNEKTEQNLSEAQQSLIKKKHEMKLSQEKIVLLDEKIDNFSRQSPLEDEICALKEAVAQLYKEKASLQNCVEERREKVATFEEILAIKLQSKCESSNSETELLRKQLGNERASMKNLESFLVSSHEKEFWSQITKQEKDSEIQFLKEQLALAGNHLDSGFKDLDC